MTPVNKTRRNGSYAPLSAHYYKDDALIQAGEKAEMLFVRGLAFCAEVLSDGFISDGQLTRFPGAGLTGVKARAEKLCLVNLWFRDDDAGGYWVRAWEKWNLSKHEIGEKLQRDSDRNRGGS